MMCLSMLPIPVLHYQFTLISPSFSHLISKSLRLYLQKISTQRVVVSNHHDNEKHAAVIILLIGGWQLPGAIELSPRICLVKVLS